MALGDETVAGPVELEGEARRAVWAEILAAAEGV